MATVVRTEFSPSNTYTSDRDPRVILHINIKTTEHGSCGTTHTFWSMDDANKFIELVRASNLTAWSICHEIAKQFPEASAERMTTPEVAWLCTPLDETPEEWTTRPRTMPA